MHKFKIILLALLIGAIFFVTHYKSQFIGLEHYDEGIRIFGAVNLLEGKIPYRDFYYHFPPGYIIYISKVFGHFGITLVNHRIAELFLRSMGVFAAVTLSMMSTGVIFGLITGFCFLTFPSDIALGSIPIILLSYIFFIRFLQKKKKSFLLLSGLLLGFSAFFRVDFSIYAILSLSVTLLIFSLIIKNNIEEKIKLTLILLIGFIVGLTPLLFFLTRSGFFTALNYLINSSRLVTYNMSLPYISIFPDIFKNITQFQNVDYHHYFKPLLFQWIFYFPYLLCLIITVELIIFRKDKIKNITLICFKVLIVLSILFFSVYMHFRSDIEHTWPVYFFVFLLLPLSIESLFKIIQKYRFVKYILVISILGVIFYLWSDYYLLLLLNYALKLSLIIVAFIFIQRIDHKWKFNINSILMCGFLLLSLLLLDYYRLYRSPQTYPKDLTLFDVPRAGKIWVSKSKEESYLNLVKYLLSDNPIRKPIFVGSTRHDAIFINDILLFFLSETNSATGYWWYNTGLQSQLGMQEKMVTELEQTKPKLVVLWALASMSNEHNASSISSNINLLDDYIREHYQVDRRYGYYYVLKRKD